MDNLSAVRPILADLIAFKTVSSTNNLDLIEYLEGIFKPAGFSTLRIYGPESKTRANLLCQIGPETAGGLMLSGHTDVVPTAGQNWHSDPFCLKEEGDRFIGRGTADMKSFIAATCLAVKKVDLRRLKRPLSLLWTYDEEIGALGSRVAANELSSHFKYLPEAAIVGEPTSFNVYCKHAGHVTLNLSVRGKGAHSSDPSLGISAIKALVQVLQGIYELEDQLKQETIDDPHFLRPFVTINVGQVEGGSAVNIVPDRAKAVVGFRPLPGTDIKEILKRIHEVIKTHCHTPGACFELSEPQILPAMLTRTDTRLSRILLPLAKTSDQGAAQFGTDAGNLNEIGIESLIFGPGSIDVAHQANEWILKSDVDQAVQKISRVIADYLF